MLLLRLRPDQEKAIRRLAAKEAEPGRRPDLSAVVRRLLDVALGLKPPKVKP